MFLMDIENFLLDLRDEYGFSLSADRLQRCLSCAQDITNVEEVLFRTQALVCTNEAQIDAFQSLFAQRFLNIHPPGPQSSAKREKPKVPRLSEVEKDRLTAEKLKQMEQQEAAKSKIAEASKQIQGQVREIEHLKKKKSELDGEVVSLRRLEQSILSAVVPDRDDPVVRKELEAVRRCLADVTVPESLAREITGMCCVRCVTRYRMRWNKHPGPAAGEILPVSKNCLRLSPRSELIRRRRGRK